MPYVKKTWADGPAGNTPILAADLNHLETQYDQATADAAAAPVKAHTHPAADVVSGVLAAARLGSGTPSASTVLRGDSTWGAPPATAPAAHTHPAADVVSGVLAAARLGSGTPDATTYLRGDGSWQVPPSGSGGGGAGFAPVYFEAGRTGGGVQLNGGDFVTYPINLERVNIGGGAFNTGSFIYTVPADGLYLCLGSIRSVDGQPATNLCIAIGTSNVDAPYTYWATHGGGNTWETRYGRQYTRLARFVTGDQLRMYIYSADNHFMTNGANAGESLAILKVAA